MSRTPPLRDLLEPPFHSVDSTGSSGEEDEDEEEYGDSDEEEDEAEDEEEDAFLVNAKLSAGAAANGGGDDPAAPKPEPIKWREPHLRPSLFLGGPAVCAFGLRACDPVPEGLLPCPEHLSRLTFKITQVGYRTVREAFKSGGWVGLVKGSEWNGLWGKIGLAQYKCLAPYQRLNHFPGTWQLGRKDNLSRNCAKQRRRVGAAACAKHPFVYFLPDDRALLERDMARMRDPVFIVKPKASSRGRGIRLITQSASIPRGNKSLVQQYIPNPLLVEGYKMDIRVYVVVTSWDPLRVYINEDGLVRFAVMKYKAGGKHYRKKGAHITNYSINKNSAAYVDSDSDCHGSKWSLQAFRRWLRDRQGIDDAKVRA